jgi:hypothetical protein
MDPEVILEKLPKKTPVWAVGIVTVLVSVVVSISSVYVLTRDDIRQRILWSEKSQDSKAEAQNSQDSKALDGVLAIVSTNMEHLAEVNKALGVAQIQSSSLSVRVSDLESAVNRLKGSLTACEDSLKICLAKNK